MREEYRRKKTVLIVDDDEFELEVHSMYLQQNYKVLTCTSGKKAIDIVQKEAIDLILLDIEMPGMNGFDTLDRIRTLENGMNVPVVGLTGNSSKVAVLNFISKGGNDYVVKPVVKENLLNKIEGLLACKEKHRYDKKILVVDDDPQSLLIIKAFLKDKYEVITLSSGKTAIEYLNKYIPDLILLDYKMTPYNGVTMLKAIRKMNNLEDVPVAFITGAEDEEVLECVFQKPDGVILKPIEKNLLRERVAGFLGEV